MVYPTHLPNTAHSDFFPFFLSLCRELSLPWPLYWQRGLSQSWFCYHLVWNLSRYRLRRSWPQSLTWHHTVALPTSATSRTVRPGCSSPSRGIISLEPCSLCLKRETENEREETFKSRSILKSAIWKSWNESTHTCSDCANAHEEHIFTWLLGYLRPSWEAGWLSFRAICSFSSWYVVSRGTDRVMVCV